MSASETVQAPSAVADPVSAARAASARSLATAVYALQAAPALAVAAFLLWLGSSDAMNSLTTAGLVLAAAVVLPPFVAVIVNYAAMNGVRGTWVESHFRWQIGTFWRTLVYVPAAFALEFLAWAVGSNGWSGSVFLLAIVGIVAVPLAVGGWYLNRVEKGWVRLWRGKPVG